MFIKMDSLYKVKTGECYRVKGGVNDRHTQMNSIRLLEHGGGSNNCTVTMVTVPSLYMGTSSQVYMYTRMYIHRQDIQ